MAPCALTVANARLAGVVLDLTLPGISGWELLGAMRALGPLPPVLLLTAGSTLDEAPATLNSLPLLRRRDRRYRTS
jgi:DNA-binding response OmpR family regulator